ncbi:7-deoxyloganetic acid glucosyltransferase-like [Dorcoceras hygrometricum]|uniref:Glycosyltransferase n=1 Tax=Dorcoceras hygrometricum TaxID=472368 RepID=A0A2Z7CYQ6_9LAMI|nr:7-deoxyloganetic acid glucosyltransferase-like [Dorcoceras hygrometricum]
MCSKESKLPPHVLIFPLPAQGHMNSMLHLAQLLCLSDIHVTFVVSEFNHRRMLTATDSALERYPGFRFQPIPDGLPEDHPRVGDRMIGCFEPAIKFMGSYFDKMMGEKDLLASANTRPVTCIIADDVLSFAADFAAARGIPLIYFRTISASAFWAFFCIDRLVEANEIPFQEIGMDELVKSIPGMEGFLRCRDLPSFCRVDDTNDPTLWSLFNIARQTARAKAVIMNTFGYLEQPILSNISKHMPRIYAIGPGNAHLRSRLGDTSTPSASLWTEDRNCINWLNAQETKSVIYVSFGSIAMVTREQILEFWHGLVNSKHKFLWVMRPGSITGEDEDQIPDVELEKGTKENGYMVEWAPQEEVLNHPAVGGFLTHSGWNSTLESIVAGVPMICWPYFGDQMVNSRLVSEVWKIGLDIKDSCNRAAIENAVRELMGVRRDEFLERADHLAKMAKQAVNEGGSSYCDLNGLIEYIDSLII